MNQLFLSLLVMLFSINSFSFEKSVKCIRYSDRACTSSPLTINTSTFTTHCEVAILIEFTDGSNQSDIIKSSGRTTNGMLNLFDLLTLGLTKGAEGLYNSSLANKQANEEMDYLLNRLSIYPVCN